MVGKKACVHNGLSTRPLQFNHSKASINTEFHIGIKSEYYKKSCYSTGYFFLKTNKKTNKHTILHPHISHPSLKPHQQQKRKTRQETDTQRQDRTLQETTWQNQTPIHSTHIFPNPYKGHKNRYTRGNITLSNMHMWNRGTELWCAHAKTTNKIQNKHIVQPQHIG